ncbi:MAG: hypothetical protein HYZ75_11310 [Elusimicrobia bacterium]|nr:hypothetical protein [Elusimicrobiota bacterium]
MSYRVRRIDPFWMAHPAVIAAAVIGLAVALVGYTRGLGALSIIGGILLGVGVLMATKPAITGVLATLGFFGGVVNFIVLPNAQLGGASLPWKLVSTLFFALLYTVLMEALVLVVAALYNLFAGSMQAGAIEIEIEEAGGDQGSEA